MALLIKRQITLTEDNDSGPFYNVYWSTNNGATYTLAVDGSSVYLPNVGSSVIVSVPSTFTTIRLESIGNCTTAFDSGSTSGTTTTTTTSTTSTTTAGTTTTTTAAPIIYGPFYSGQNMFDGGVNESTACGSTVSWPFYTDASSVANIGFGNKIYTDSSGETVWVGNGSYYGINTTSFTSAVKAIVIQSTGFVSGISDCSTTTTTTSTTSTTSTTTASPLTLTQIWSDAIPGYGNLQSCGCTGEIGVFNFSILGDYDIYQDLTGRTVYADNVGDDLFVGDDLWYCITDVENTETTISIQINNSGIVTGWVDCTTTTTTTTSSTTTTTTSAVSCNEYLVTCTLGNPLGCNVSYTDCNGTFQSYTQPEDTDYPLCARPTPSVSGGFVTFLGDCGLTTTTTAATTTTTTTTPLKTWYGSFDHLSSEHACGFGPDDFPNTYKHDGSISYPRIGDTVYYSNGTTPLDAAWYYIFTDDKSIEVNASGIVIDLVDCSGLL